MVQLGPCFETVRARFHASARKQAMLCRCMRTACAHLPQQQTRVGANAREAVGCERYYADDAAEAHNKSK
eukprot:6172577-Pleurochrysis_carterae.AAC.1